ncbi:MAG: DinB family protein [Bacteroidota bacterium]
MIEKPEPEEYEDYYGFFIEKVLSEDILAFLHQQANNFIYLLKSLNENQLNHRYKEGKWTTKELFGHLTDVERIFAYRVLAISRGDKGKLPGYDPETYVSIGNYDNRPIESIIDEYLMLRKSNINMFGSLSKEMLKTRGNVNGSMLSARAIIYLIAGHQKHHESVLKEKYLSK